MLNRAKYLFVNRLWQLGFALCLVSAFLSSASADRHLSNFESADGSRSEAAMPQTDANGCIQKTSHPSGSSDLPYVVAVKNTCGKTVVVTWCFKAGNQKCYTCTDGNYLDPNEATPASWTQTRRGYCRTGDCGDVDVQWNAGFAKHPECHHSDTCGASDEVTVPRPSVPTGCGSNAR
jgi:hypothetical protein